MAELNGTGRSLSATAQTTVPGNRIIHHPQSRMLNPFTLNPSSAQVRPVSPIVARTITEST
ncbi:hypothetical protein K443DRAFT_299264 [Laccaria amethystina LaAM-08-1]|uniref:Uncharacterized protein n=1 Tax=Laccaria amethystina LaAM-08-1 TaxID=1095629 RepID=A0A0C9Y6U6_9AGAR|nr:hypothetical protein K443DRAFT_299264 [Laccaria amethystina LaAM-08-1]